MGASSSPLFVLLAPSPMHITLSLPSLTSGPGDIFLISGCLNKDEHNTEIPSWPGPWAELHGPSETARSHCLDEQQ